MPRLIFSILILLDPGSAAQPERSLPVSQDTFGAVVGRLISNTYDALTNEIDDLNPAIDYCSAEISTKVSSCTDCVETLSCKRPSGVTRYLQAVGAIRADSYISTIEKGLQRVTSQLSGAAEDIYNKYGEDVLDTLEAKVKEIGVFKTSLKNAAEKAGKTVDDAKKKAKNLKKKLKKKLGKRRRRDLIISEVELPEITEEQKQCLRECPDCDAFLTSDILVITSSICGDSFAGQFQTLCSRVSQLQAFVNEWLETTEDKRDFLKEILVDEATATVTKVTVWRSQQYKTYQISPPIPVSIWNLESTYQAIALYILNTY